MCNTKTSFGFIIGIKWTKIWKQRIRNDYYICGVAQYYRKNFVSFTRPMADSQRQIQGASRFSLFSEGSEEELVRCNTNIEIWQLLQ
uniref:Uncharacterized protein n=1 Tax=Rhizophora mucronata TaxID=61149 RepID=A0A2P2LHB5_RHIMU